MDIQPKRDSLKNESTTHDNSAPHSATQRSAHKPALTEVSSAVHSTTQAPINQTGLTQAPPISQNDSNSAPNPGVDQLILDNLKERQRVEPNNYFDYLNDAFDSYVLDDPETYESDNDAAPTKTSVIKSASSTKTEWNNPFIKSPKELVVITLTLLFEAWLIGLFDAPAANNTTHTQTPIVSPLQEEIDQLLADITTLQTTLDSHQTELAGHIAKSNAANLKRWQILTNDYLIAGSQLNQAQQDLQTAKEHLSDGYLEQAHVTLRGVKVNYEYLVDEFEAAGKVYPAEKQASLANRKWFQHKQYYSLKDTEYVASAKASEQSAQAMELSADFSLAESYWLLAEQLWTLSYDSTQDRASQIDNWLVRQKEKQQKAEEARQAELARQAAIQREQELAAAEAKRLADLAEAQRLAQIEAEKRKQEEIKNQRLVTLAVGRMIDIPAGSFRMGCEGEECLPEELPARDVRIQSFRMGEAEVTFEQWDACVELGGCTYKPKDDGWGRGTRPVIRVSFEDIVNEFLPTLNKYSGRTFRLPTEAEWEYAARAGATTQFAWGDELEDDQANCAKCSSTDDFKRTTEIKQFIPNGFGLYDIHGNVWEWTQDCWKPSYEGASSSGQAYLGAQDKDELWIYNECQKRVLRGGSWDFSRSFQTLGRRNWNPVDTRSNSYGFRLVEDI